MTRKEEIKGRGVSTGVDVVSIARIARAAARKRFLERVYTCKELENAFKGRRPERFLASAFAAKEACAKALGSGFGARLGLLDIEVTPGLPPTLKLHSRALELLGGRRAFLSLSSTTDTALAFVVIE